jgi:hypothetical protein
MKKTLLLFTLLLSIYSQAYSQNWALPSSQWRYYLYTWAGTPIIDVRVEKDTTVENIHCKKISSNWNGPMYTYESGDTAYIFWQGLFRPTYFFNGHVGDSVVYYLSACAPPDTLVHGVIDSIGRMYIGADTLKTFRVSLRPTGHLLNPTQITYAERIGALGPYYSGTFFYPYFGCITDYDDPAFCNYGDSTLASFWIDTARHCSTVGIEETKSETGIYPAPNPASTYLHTEADLKHYAILISDLTGRVYSCPIQGQDIDIRTLASGIYLISLTDRDKRTVRRFVKE